MTAALEVPVLIVGAGPVGLTSSLLLARSGIKSLVVERRDGPHRAPQAHVLNPRSLEICRGLGLDMDALEAASTPRTDGAEVSWRTALFGEELGRLPYERQGDENLAFTPTPLRNLSQHRFEPILLENVRSVSEIEVRYGHQWQSFTQDDRSVSAVIEDLASGNTYEVRCRYLLAADGASSCVRKATGIQMLGPDEIQRFVMIHFQAALRAQLSELGNDPAILYWSVTPEGIGAFIAHDIDSTWVFMHPVDIQSDQAGRNYDEDGCRAIVQQAMGRNDVEFTIRDISRWTMTAQVAASYRAGRVFLVGDSGHKFPPSGGMGMNTGIQDAHNLVWKIRAVEDGWAPPSLLDSYDSERRPVAQNNAAQSVNNAMKMWEVVQALGIMPGDVEASRERMTAALADADARAALAAAIENQREHFDMVGLHLGFSYENGAVIPDGSAPVNAPNRVSEYTPTSRPGSRLPHAWVEQHGKRVSILDLIAYDRFTLILGADTQAPTYSGAVPLRILRPGSDFFDTDGMWAGVDGITAEDALLVRPDAHVAWRGRGPDLKELLTAVLGDRLKTHPPGRVGQ